MAAKNRMQEQHIPISMSSSPLKSKQQRPRIRQRSLRIFGKRRKQAKFHYSSCVRVSLKPTGPSVSKGSFHHRFENVRVARRSSTPLIHQSRSTAVRPRKEE